MFKFLLFIFIIFSASANEKLISSKDIEDEKKSVQRIWNGQGVVVVGKIKDHDKFQISSRTPIYKDGSFCTAIYRNRELIFFSHGFEALLAFNKVKVLDALRNAKEGEIPLINVGEIAFKKSTQESLRTLQGKITLKDAPSKDHTATLTLIVQNNKYLFQDHGNSGGATLRQKALDTKVKSGEIFKFQELSKIPYLLKIESKGYVSQYSEFDENFNGDVNFGNIVLFPAPTLKISYRARVKKNNGEWIEDKKDNEITIACNGESNFVFSKLKDGLGNGLDLRIRPDDDGVKASFFYHQKNSFYNLGKINLHNIQDWNVNLLGLDGDTKAYLQKGHTYFFNIKSINKTQIELLFKVEE